MPSQKITFDAMLRRLRTYGRAIWGLIEGNIADQADLVEFIDARTALGINHYPASIELNAHGNPVRATETGVGPESLMRVADYTYTDDGADQKISSIEIRLYESDGTTFRRGARADYEYPDATHIVKTVEPLES